MATSEEDNGKGHPREVLINGCCPLEHRKMVHLFVGEEEFLKQDALNKLKLQVLTGDSASLNYDVFYGQDRNVEKIIECAKTAPFIASKRMVVVKNLEDLGPAQLKVLASYLEVPHPSCVLVLESSQASGALQEIYKLVSKYGKVEYFKPLAWGQLNTWIFNRVRFYGKKIRTDAAKALVENVGTELGKLEGAIESLVCYLGQGSQITISDVEVLIGRDLESTTFDLVDAIGLKDLTKGLEVLEVLIRDGKKAPGIIGFIGWHLRRVWSAKQLLNDGLSREEVGRHMKIPYHFLNKFLRQVSNFEVEQIKKGLRNLLRLDIQVKSGERKPEQALELLIVELCR